jgi:hypothetical protein
MNNIIKGHETIVLEITSLDTNGGYRMEILDPNGPRLDTFICKKTICGGHSFYGCSSPNYPGNFFVPIDSKDVSTLVASLNSFCRSNSQSKFCKDRYSNTSLWLKNNYPLIDNPAGSTERGSCFGWSDFILKVTYLGEFGYECPRAGASSVSIFKQTQLANIQESISQIIEQIGALVSKTSS